MAEKKTDKVRIGVIGIGNMGSAHCRTVCTTENAELTAVCDIDETKFGKLPEEAGDKVRKYTSPETFFAEAPVDAVIISVPHYDHVPLAMQALQAGKHILVEKPIAPAVGMARELIAEGKKYPHLVQSAMLQLRTMEAFLKIRELLAAGELGRLMRINWIVTTWFRSQFYYDSGDWRASWRGEGGGVLLNQCPHQLDLLQWLFGLPSKVRATVAIGKYHDIEVEDEVNAFMEFPGGATGVFVTSSGEAPGTNRLEIAGTKGRLVYENKEIKFSRNEVPSDEFLRDSKDIFGVPKHEDVPLPEIKGITGARHFLLIRNFVNAILKGEELIALLHEAVNGLELGNAMLYSGLKNETVTLPLDSAAYARLLSDLVAGSRYVKKKVSGSIGTADLNASYS